MRMLLGSCTKHNRIEFEKTSLYNTVLKDLECEYTDTTALYTGDIDAVIKLKNKENIGKFYNRTIELAISENYDCLILMHDDVSVEDKFLVKKLTKAFEAGFDIVGVAGARDAKIQRPALWHLMSGQEHWSGAVAHPHQEGGVHITAFGPTPRRCVIMDGVFLAINVNSISTYGGHEVRFDENIPAIAHMYDIDFCLNANKHKLKLTTWPIWLVHNSPGLMSQDKEFLDAEKYFLNKWIN